MSGMIPVAGTPVIDLATGKMTPPWYAYLASALSTSDITPFAPPPAENGSNIAARNVGYRIVAAGQAVLVAGTVTVSNTNAVSTNQFFLTNRGVGGTPGILAVGTITANTSFVINSSNAADISTVSWAILAPIRG